jgi:DNA-binding CsgD family transcriptional regulator
MNAVNELGVIVEFAKNASAYGFEIVSISDAYPDAIIQKDGTTYRAEFEFKSSNFDMHGHDIRECDLVICWENDSPDFALPVIEISNPDWFTKPIVLTSTDKRESYYWRLKAIRLEKRLRAIEIKSKEAEGGAQSPEPLVIFCGKEPGDLDKRDRQRAITQLSNSGVLQKDIARILGVTVKTVQRDIKDLEEENYEQDKNGYNNE